MSPAKGLLDILNGLTSPAYSDTGWNVAVGRLTPTPDKQVVLRDSGGSSGEVAVAIDYPAVQIIARGGPGAGGYDEAYSKLDQAYKALVGIPQATEYPELTSCVARGHILDLGYDDKQRPQFALNLALIVSYASSGYREAL